MTSFDLDAFLTLPRVSGLAVAPDGSRVVVATSAPDGTRFTSTLWEVVAGEQAPRRLTRADASAPVFAADGSLLFLRRGEGATSLWRLPSEGEAHELLASVGGVERVATARAGRRAVAATRLLEKAASVEDDRERDEARRDAGVTAQLHTSYPVRYWDHWLGPRFRRLLAADLADDASPPAWHDLSPDAGPALEDATFDISADGTRVATTWWREAADPRERVKDLVVIDTETGARHVASAAERASHDAPAWSPDGRCLVAELAWLGGPDDAPDRTLVLVDLDSGERRDLLPDFDRWPEAPAWTPDGRFVLFVADDDGHRLPYRLEVETGALTRVAEQGAFGDLVVDPAGPTVYALRSGIAEAPTPVRLHAHDPHAAPTPLAAPRGEVAPPGRVERITATADDGATVPGWLVLPPEISAPAPLAVFVHGGPLGSWNAWHWRWNPHVLAARGWAVLLPDPALSTGYGMEFVRRGWGRWGAEPYTDVMAAVEHVARRDDVDGDRAALLGGSFGGYMANWVATQTERFDAIVTHASLWNLEAFHGTTDLGPVWEHQFGDRYIEPARYRQWSPHQHVDRITTPMLVIHGERDFRVPYGEALTLVTDLARHGAPVAYLHFPDEHHWVLTPPHARVWYDTVIAFLDHHVLGEPWRRPDLV